MEFAPLVVAISIVLTAMAVLKHIRAGQMNDVLTIVVVLAVSVGVAFLLRGSDFAGGIDVGGKALADLNGASTVLFGVALGSASRTAYQTLKAVDHSQSAAEPKLIPPSSPGGE